MNINYYTYRVTWSSDDNEHVGLCAEFPSLSWLAPSPEKALSGTRNVVADVVEEMTASRESVPGSKTHPIRYCLQIRTFSLDLQIMIPRQATTTFRQNVCSQIRPVVKPHSTGG